MEVKGEIAILKTEDAQKTVEMNKDKKMQLTWTRNQSGYWQTYFQGNSHTAGG